jgi:hypothetical protein
MSDTHCDVSLGEYDADDEGTFYSESTVTARKAHVCRECREVIVPGQQYLRVAGKWDGDVCAYKFCLPCWEIMGEFSERGRTFGITWDTFRDEWHDGANLQGCLNRLTTAAAKALMLRQWQRWKKLA